MGIRQERLMIWIILIVGLILRLISLGQSLWLDEAINIQAAKNFSLFDLVTQYAKADFHPPGHFIILWLWTKLFGYSEIAVRMPSVIFGVLAVWVSFLIGKKLVSERLGLLAALLVAINPLHIYYSQEARMYAMAVLAVSVNILLLIKLIKRGKLNMVLYTLSNLLVLASDYVAYFIFPAQLIFLVIQKNWAIVKKWFIVLIISILLGIWWLPIFLDQLNVGVVASSNLPTWKNVLGTFDFKTLPLTFVKFIIGRISLADKLIYAFILLPVSGLFGFLLWRGIKSTASLTRKLLLCWIIIPLTLATVISLVIPIYNYFRVLFVIPPFIMLISLGVLSAKLRLQLFFLITVFLIEIYCTLVYLLNPSFHREDWRGLVNFFKNQSKGSIILFESTGTLPPFDYYAQDQISAKGALRDFPAREETDVADLENILKGYQHTYLVDYLVQISDPDRLVAKKLNSLGYKQTGIKNFNGVGFVYLYTRK